MIWFTSVHAAFDCSFCPSSGPCCHFGHGASTSSVNNPKHIPFITILVVNKLRIIFIMSPRDHFFVGGYNYTPVSQRGFRLMYILVLNLPKRLLLDSLYSFRYVEVKRFLLSVSVPTGWLRENK